MHRELGPRPAPWAMSWLCPAVVMIAKCSQYFYARYSGRTATHCFGPKFILRRWSERPDLINRRWWCLGGFIFPIYSLIVLYQILNSILWTLYSVVYDSQGYCSWVNLGGSSLHTWSSCPCGLVHLPTHQYIYILALELKKTFCIPIAGEIHTFCCRGCMYWLCGAQSGRGPEKRRSRGLLLQPTWKMHKLSG